MTTEISVYIENKLNNEERLNFESVIEAAFEGVAKTEPTAHWHYCPSDHDDDLDGCLPKPTNIIEYIDVCGGVIFWGPHYYHVVLHNKMICITSLADARVLAEERGFSLAKEINRICQNLGAGRCLYTRYSDLVSEFVDKNHGWEEIKLYINESNNSQNYPARNIRELGHRNGMYCEVDLSGRLKDVMKEYY